MSEADFRIHDQGSVVGIEPISDDARAWMDANVASESWQWMGSVLYGDARMIPPVVDGMINDGLVVEGAT